MTAEIGSIGLTGKGEPPKNLTLLNLSPSGFLISNGPLTTFTRDNTQFTEPYLREFYSYVEPDEIEAIRWRIKKMFQSVGLQEAALVFGAGPTMHDALVLAPHVDEIHLSDYLDRNLQALEDWVLGKDGSWDWTPFIEYIHKVETGRPATLEDVRKREYLTRSRVRQIFHCDARQERPLGRFAHYPLVTNMFVADSAADNPATYVKWMHHIASLVEPGGHYLTAALSNTDAYSVGGVLYPSAFVTPRILRQALQLDFSRKYTEVRDVPVQGHEKQGYSSILLAYTRKRVARAGIPQAG